MKNSSAQPLDLLYFGQRPSGRYEVVSLINTETTKAGQTTLLVDEPTYLSSDIISSLDLTSTSEEIDLSFSQRPRDFLSQVRQSRADRLRQVIAEQIAKSQKRRKSKLATNASEQDSTQEGDSNDPTSSRTNGISKTTSTTSTTTVKRAPRKSKLSARTQTAISQLPPELRALFG